MTANQSINLQFNNLDVNFAQALMTAFHEIQRAIAPASVARPAQAVQSTAPAQPAPVEQSAPPVQPAQPAQIAPAQVTSAPAIAQGPVDALGVPYNPDIHGSLEGKSGGKTGDGVWRIKRGVDKRLYNEWRERHQQAATAQPAQAATAQPATAQPATAQPATAQSFGQPAQAFGQPATAAHPMTDQQLIDPGYDVLLAKANQLDAAGVLTWDRTQAIMDKCGTKDNAEVLTNPEFRKIAWRELQILETSAALAA